MTPEMYFQLLGEPCTYQGVPGVFSSISIDPDNPSFIRYGFSREDDLHCQEMLTLMEFSNRVRFRHG